MPEEEFVELVEDNNFDEKYARPRSHSTSWADMYMQHRFLFLVAISIVGIGIGGGLAWLLVS